jgi:membrane protein required for colicin V production
VAPIDYIFLFLFGVPLVYGLFRGIVRMVITVLSVYLGFVFARQYSLAIAAAFEQWTEGFGKYGETLVFLLCFAAVVFLVSMLGRLIRKGIHGANLGCLDRALGAMVGGVLGLMLSFGLIFMVFTYLPDPDRYLRNSRLSPAIVNSGTYLLILVPPWLEEGVQDEYDRLRRLLDRRLEEGTDAVSVQPRSQVSGVPSVRA